MKDKSHNILSEFMILCLAAFVAILGHMQHAGCELDTPGRGKLFNMPCNFKWYSFEKKRRTNHKTEWLTTPPNPRDHEVSY